MWILYRVTELKALTDRRESRNDIAAALIMEKVHVDMIVVFPYVGDKFGKKFRHHKPFDRVGDGAQAFSRVYFLSKYELDLYRRVGARSGVSGRVQWDYYSFESGKFEAWVTSSRLIPGSVHETMASVRSNNDISPSCSRENSLVTTLIGLP